MGSDLSKPKNKKNDPNSLRCAAGKPYSRSMIFRDIDCEISDAYLNERQYNNCTSYSPQAYNSYVNCPPSMPKPILKQTYCPTQPSNCTDAQINFRPARQIITETSPKLIEPCRDPCRDRYGTSPVVSHPSTPVSRSPIYCPEIPNIEKNCRPVRYKTARPTICRAENEYYINKYESVEPVKCIEKNPRQYPTKQYHPNIYDSMSKSKLPNEISDIIPNERVYEIRKEKIMIRADRGERCSRSPPKLRSKSSDRYLDSKNVYEDAPGPRVEHYPRKSNYFDSNHRDKLHSRSGYGYDFVTNIEKDNIDNNYTMRRSSRGNQKSSDRSNSPPSSNRDTFTDINDSYVKSKIINDNNNNNNTHILNNIGKPPQTIGNSDIIYVPMVREEFMKRESQKINESENQHTIIKTPKNISHLSMSCTTTTSLTRPSKIIISEINPVQATKPTDAESSTVAITTASSSSSSSSSSSNSTVEPSLTDKAQLISPDNITITSNINSNLTSNTDNYFRSYNNNYFEEHNDFTRLLFQNEQQQENKNRMDSAFKPINSIMKTDTRYKSSPNVNRVNHVKLSNQVNKMMYEEYIDSLSAEGIYSSNSNCNNKSSILNDSNTNINKQNLNSTNNKSLTILIDSEKTDQSSKTKIIDDILQQAKIFNLRDLIKP